MDNVPHQPSDDASERVDLAERLANYRSRVEREGRKAALRSIDRAIDEARRKRKPPK
ncbi:MAG TPA: hypothetical protein VHN55_10090 [Sphingomicrobium sp.]|nr:hypothetical protein [Sphingomicrobium sp.]